ncbi:MAG: hypothetical protein Q8N98_01575 [bacterium]|nr:hypothetical protein [bacterium]
MNNAIAITDKSKIFRYDGREGLLRATLNSLEAKEEILIYETSYASLNDFLEKGRAEEIRKEFLRKGIKIRELTNQPYHEIYTDVALYHEKVMDIRYINPDKLKIDTELLIYNDVLAFYTLKSPIFAVEIYDKDLAYMQKQIFEFMWNFAERPVLGKNGRTSMF